MPVAPMADGLAIAKLDRQNVFATLNDYKLLGIDPGQVKTLRS
ncbi:MAG: hypothetical protein AAF808_01950 [Cyanobacteria bacterium P01_D01_bin.2]